MKLLKYYLRDSAGLILFFFLMLFIIDLILFSSTDLNRSVQDILYLNLLFLFLLLIFLAIDYTKWRNSYGELLRVVELGGNIDNLAPEGNRLEQVLIREIIDLKNREKLQETEGLKRNLAEIDDYITKWVHEIKIPLSVCELIAGKLEEEELDDLAMELIHETERINFLVNQVLHMSRASSYSQDFTVEEVNLGSLVRNVIKNNMNSFIARKIELELGELDFNILTDRKWAYYVIEQIVNNACKYVDNYGIIKIHGKETDEKVILSIWDNGMGIPAKDIGRIFDRGFTGENGRKTARSTGMGLYIAKKIADQLNFDIEVSSQVSRYTEFRVIFYKLSDYLNVTKM